MDSLDPKDWKCPSCGENHFTEGGKFSTLLHYTPMYKDGVNVNPDRNTITLSRNCCNCGDTFRIAGNAYSGWSVSKVDDWVPDLEHE